MPDKDIPLISICVPTYNGESFIKASLESLFSQSFKNYEVIVCDDGSKDKTVQVIKDCIKGRENILLIENEVNLGLVGNWNKCVSLSKGKYIKFLFQDDLITPGALEKIASVIKEHKPSFITSKRKFILPPTYNEGAHFHFNTYLQKFEYDLGIKRDKFISLKEIAKLTAKYIGINYIGEPSVYVFRRELVERIGNFDNTFQQLCDLEFALRGISSSELFYINDITCEFMIHEASATVVNIRTRHYQITYFEYINLTSKLLYDKKYFNLRNAFNSIEKLKLKVYLNNKIYTALNDSQVSPEEKDQLKNFIGDYPNKAYKTFGALFFLISKVLKIKNAKQ